MRPRLVTATLACLLTTFNASCGDKCQGPDGIQVKCSDLQPYENDTYTPSTGPSSSLTEHIPTSTNPDTDSTTDTPDETTTGTSESPDTTSTTATTDDTTIGTTSPPELCGNGILDGNEACDDGIADNLGEYGGCNSDCTLASYCGDGVVDADDDHEACDGDGMGAGGETMICNVDCTASACGDGKHNTTAGEKCDDSNKSDGDGCTGDCSARERQVFVSSMPFTAAQLGGVLGADSRCNSMAMTAQLSGKFKAWLSTDIVSPSTRFDTEFEGLYRLRAFGFPIVAVGWSGLATGMTHLIDATEEGQTLGEMVNVWTNTLANGTPASTSDDCGDWSDSSKKSSVGVTKDTMEPDDWTDFAAGQLCNNAQRIYCFEDPD